MIQIEIYIFIFDMSAPSTKYQKCSYDFVKTLLDVEWLSIMKIFDNEKNSFMHMLCTESFTMCDI